MNNLEDINNLTQIIKDGALKFHDDFNKNLKSYFLVENQDNDRIIHFYIEYYKTLEYKIFFKKQKTISDHIPNLNGYTKLDLSSNPFTKLRFTDENTILANIYDLIQKINFEEIACYEKFGIILLNPLKLTGIYNINIQFVS